jgi:hypothetical protein
LHSLWMLRPTSTRSNKLGRSSMTLMWLRSILWWDLMETKRRMLTGSWLWSSDVVNRIRII